MISSDCKASQNTRRATEITALQVDPVNWINIGGASVGARLAATIP